jgi:hypothetical protein
VLPLVFVFFDGTDGDVAVRPKPLIFNPAGTEGQVLADVKPGLAAFMADSQVPWGVQALSGTVTEPAWKSKPSWYMVTTEDRMIPLGAQPAMSKRAGSKVTEIKGSHAVFTSQPAAVASLIEQAANGSGPTVK